MKHFISKISTIAIAGIMMTTAMTGCGNNKDSENSSSVSETTTSSASTTMATTIGTSDTSETTTIAETTEEVTETTPLADALTDEEDDWLTEWKNSDAYINGISDLRENIDNLYAVHVLIGGDAIKAYELGFDKVTSGYDLVWKFDDEEKYYMRKFADNQNLTIDPSFDCILNAKREIVGDEVYDNLAYNKITTRFFLNSNKNDRYNPFENGEAEYKDNTVCIVWQETEGTLDGAKAFYYSINKSDYDTILEKAFDHCTAEVEDKDIDYYINHKIEVIEDNSVFDITGTGSLSEDALNFGITIVEETTQE